MKSKSEYTCSMASVLVYIDKPCGVYLFVQQVMIASHMPLKIKISFSTIKLEFPW